MYIDVVNALQNNYFKKILESLIKSQARNHLLCPKSVLMGYPKCSLYFYQDLKTVSDSK